MSNKRRGCADCFNNLSYHCNPDSSAMRHCLFLFDKLSSLLHRLLLIMGYGDTFHFIVHVDPLTKSLEPEGFLLPAK